MVRSRLATAIAVLAVLLVAFGLVVGALTRTADPNPAVDLSEKGALGPAHGFATTTTTEPPSTTSGRLGTYASGAGLDLPEGWPDEVKVPPGANITQSSKAGLTFQASGPLLEAPQDVYREVLDGLTGAGFQFSAKSFASTPEGGFGTLSGTNDRYSVSVYIGPDSGGRAGNIITITLGKQD